MSQTPVPAPKRPRPITRYLLCLLLAAVALSGSLTFAIELVGFLASNIVHGHNGFWRIEYYGNIGYFATFLGGFSVFACLAVAATAWRFRKK
jgi:hypothetical protein